VACNYLRQGGYVIVVVCLLETLRKNFRTDWHEISREGWQWDNEQTNDYFGGDPDHRLDAGIVFRIRHYGKWLMDINLLLIYAY